MKSLVDLINDSFGDKYFESKITHRNTGESDNYDACVKFKHLYEAELHYIRDDSNVIRMKKYSENDFDLKELEDFVDYFNEIIVRNLLFSKPAKKNDNICDGNEYFMKTFADYKNEIIKIMKKIENK